MPTGSAPQVRARRICSRCRGRVGGIGGLHDPGDVTERAEVGQRDCRGVQALPEVGEDLDGPHDMRVDPELGEQVGNLQGVVQAVSGRALMRRPRRAMFVCAGLQVSLKRCVIATCGRHGTATQ